MGPILERKVVVARRSPSLTLEIAVQFHMHVVGYYHSKDNHNGILSLDIASSNVFLV